jgi:hypothetical protein
MIFVRVQKIAKTNHYFSSRLPVFLSVRMEQLGTQRKDFHEV